MKTAFHLDISVAIGAQYALAGYCVRAGNGVEAGDIGNITITGY